MKIGENIKRLRKAQDITQEKLADYLGITYQAVSKWENGTALPDITLIPPLARFFGISADQLMAINHDQNDAEIETALAQVEQHLAKGDVPASIDVLRTARKEHPRSFKLMTELAKAIKMHYMGTPEKDIALVNEQIQLCETVLEDCTEDKQRHRAIYVLCSAYKEAGQQEKAVALAKTMPDTFQCADRLLLDALEGEERIKQLQANIVNFTTWVMQDLLTVARNDETKTNQQRIHTIQTVFKLQEAIFYDGNLLRAHLKASECNGLMAELYMPDEPEKALQALLQAEKHAIAFDALPDHAQPYTAHFIETQVCHGRGGKNIPFTMYQWVLSILQSKAALFAPLQGNPEFEALRTRVSQA